MADLKTRYMGLELMNPLVASSSPQCKELDSVKRMEDAGASAVVLHSLFEEQVTIEEERLNDFLLTGTEHYAEALTYFPSVDSFRFAPDEYVEYIRKVKDSVAIPVMGSLNGTSKGGWIRYAKEIEQAGADAIELNIYLLPTDPGMTGAEVETNYIELAREVKRSVKIPVAVKLGPYFSSIPAVAGDLAKAGADAIVLFNRFYQPSIDPEKLEVSPDIVLSSREELNLRLRWIGILYGRISGLDLAVTGGVHTPIDIVRSLMAGAKVAMTTSALLKMGIGYIDDLVSGLAKWLDGHGYESVSKITGLMSQQSVAEPAAFERANYMKLLNAYRLPD
jgi:dihydroorotate dehydrogenase (fumarate)